MDNDQKNQPLNSGLSAPNAGVSPTAQNPNSPARPVSGAATNAASAASPASKTPVAASRTSASASKAKPTGKTPTASKASSATSATAPKTPTAASPDRDQQENRLSGANRGEFGAQAPGATQGGYGNQYREPNERQYDTDRGYYYGSDRPSGGYSQHPNSYQDYSGRASTERGYERDYDRDYRNDQRSYDRYAPESRNDRGYSRPGYQPNADWDRDEQDRWARPERRRDQYEQPSNRQWDERPRWTSHPNDNGSRPSQDRGYSDDYGRSSLRGNPDYRDQPSARRNQTDDYRPHSGYDAREETRRPSAWNNSPDRYDSNRYDDYRSTNNDWRNQDERYRRPQADSRNSQRDAYGSYPGNDRDGFGSRGGSYNDEYSSGNRDQRGGSPARGDYRDQDRNRNYGPSSRDQYRNRQEDEPDYGSSPRRNRARDEDDYR